MLWRNGYELAQFVCTGTIKLAVLRRTSGRMRPMTKLSRSAEEKNQDKIKEDQQKEKDQDKKIRRTSGRRRTKMKIRRTSRRRRIKMKIRRTRGRRRTMMKISRTMMTIRRTR